MRLAPALALALALTVSGTVQAQDDAETKASPRIQVKQGETTATELIYRWAIATDRLPQLDPQVETIRIKFAEAGEVDVPTLHRILDLHDVVVIETGPLLVAHHRRNLAQKEGPPWGPVFSGKTPTRDNVLVTAVLPVKHGAGNAIFATVRGLLTRDTNRIGNILYVQGGHSSQDTIIIVDLAPKVAYYQDVIERLDRAPRRAKVEVSVTEVPRVLWRGLARMPGDRLLASVRNAVEKGEATSIEEAWLTTVVGGDFEVRRRVTLKTGEHGSLAMSVGSPEAAAKDQPVVVRGASNPTTDLSIDLTLLSRDREQILQRSFKAPLPDTYADGGVHTFAFSGREGEDATTIVVTLTAK